MQVKRINKFGFILFILLTLSVLFLCTSIYLHFKLSILISSATSPKLLQTEKSSDESNSELDNEFLVNTLGCKMTRLPVMTSKIQEFFKPPDRIVCSPPSITESDECKN